MLGMAFVRIRSEKHREVGIGYILGFFDTPHLLFVQAFFNLVFFLTCVPANYF